MDEWIYGWAKKWQTRRQIEEGTNERANDWNFKESQELLYERKYEKSTDESTGEEVDKWTSG